jgi:hypothetical protein
MKTRCVQIVLASSLVLACAETEVPKEASCASAVSALTEEHYRYFRCNATDWDVNSKTRLKPLGYARVALTYDVEAEWMRTHGDNCSLTETNAVDSWGTWQAFYLPHFNGVGVESLLGSPQPEPQSTFTVKYPLLGRYQISLADWDDSFSIAAAVVPERAQAVIGTPVTFSTHLLGSGLTYRWQTKYEYQDEDAWVDLPGADESSLQVITGDFYMFCAQYRAIVSTPQGAMASAPATLVNQLPPPVFTLDLPAEVTVTEGSPLTLSVATDPSASFYVWKRNGVTVPDGNFGSGTYTTSPLTAADDNATYSVEAVRFAGNHQCTQHGRALSRITTVHVMSR